MQYNGATLKERIKGAFLVLSGKSWIADSPCAQEHLPPNYAAVSKDRLNALEGATDELKFALGFIAHSQNRTYEESVVKAIGKAYRA